MIDKIKIIGGKIILKLKNGERVAVNIDTCEILESDGETWVYSPLVETAHVQASFDDIVEELEAHRCYLLMEGNLSNRDLLSFYEGN